MWPSILISTVINNGLTLTNEYHRDANRDDR